MTPGKILGSLLMIAIAMTDIPLAFNNDGNKAYGSQIQLSGSSTSLAISEEQRLMDR